MGVVWSYSNVRILHKLVIKKNHAQIVPALDQGYFSPPRKNAEHARVTTTTVTLAMVKQN